MLSTLRGTYKQSIVARAKNIFLANRSLFVRYFSRNKYPRAVLPYRPAAVPLHRQCIAAIAGYTLHSSNPTSTACTLPLTHCPAACPSRFTLTRRTATLQGSGCHEGGLRHVPVTTRRCGGLLPWRRCSSSCCGRPLTHRCVACSVATVQVEGPRTQLQASQSLTYGV